MGKIHRIKTILLSLFAFIILASAINFLGSNRFKSPMHSNLVHLENGWTVRHADKVFTPAVLSKCDIGIANMDDVITLTKRLSDYDLHPATIHFRSILSCVDVYLDGQLIYSFGNEYAEKGLMLPKIEHFINLPDNYPGKELTIVYTSKEDNAFSGMSPITLGTMEVISRSMAQDGRLTLFIAVFLVMFGFMVLVMSPILLYNGNHDLSITFSGLISLLLGIYILCFNDLFWLFTDKAPLYTFLEYFSLFMLPASILLFLTTAGQIRTKTISLILGIVNYGFAFTTAALHLTNLVHICHFVTYLHFISLIEGLYIIIALTISVIKRYYSADELSSKSQSTNMLLLGLFLFLTCAVIDIVKFNIQKYVSSGEVNANINFMTVGALLFIVCLILNYFFHCIEYINESTMKKKLEGLAYTDALTNISNRSKCELALAELEGDYTIVSIDLDYLKYTNDTYGHSAGDKLLKGFSAILSNSFTDASLVGRMGGDEFIIILPYIDEPRLERDFVCMRDLMEHRSQTDAPIKYSASYGYADSKDSKLGPGANAHKVYLLADARMYKMKNHHHKQTIGRLCDDLVKTEKGGSKDE